MLEYLFIPHVCDSLVRSHFKKCMPTYFSYRRDVQLLKQYCWLLEFWTDLKPIYSQCCLKITLMLLKSSIEHWYVSLLWVALQYFLFLWDPGEHPLAVCKSKRCNIISNFALYCGRWILFQIWLSTFTEWVHGCFCILMGMLNHQDLFFLFGCIESVRDLHHHG
jgi:hypothetical protein